MIIGRSDGGDQLGRRQRRLQDRPAPVPGVSSRKLQGSADRRPASETTIPTQSPSRTRRPRFEVGVLHRLTVDEDAVGAVEVEQQRRPADRPADLGVPPGGGVAGDDAAVQPGSPPERRRPRARRRVSRPRPSSGRPSRIASVLRRPRSARQYRVGSRRVLPARSPSPIRIITGVKNRCKRRTCGAPQRTVHLCPTDQIWSTSTRVREGGDHQRRPGDEGSRAGEGWSAPAPERGRSAPRESVPDRYQYLTRSAQAEWVGSRRPRSRPLAHRRHEGPGARSGGPPREVQRFIREAQITAQLDHPNIAPVYEIGVDRQGNRYFTMKRIEGDTLADWSARAGRQAGFSEALSEMMAAFLKVCEAVAFAHSRGVLHCDIKPGNILVGPVRAGLPGRLGAGDRGGGARPCRTRCRPWSSPGTQPRRRGRAVRHAVVHVARAGDGRARQVRRADRRVRPGRRPLQHPDRRAAPSTPTTSQPASTRPRPAWSPSPRAIPPPRSPSASAGSSGGRWPAIPTTGIRRCQELKKDVEMTLRGFPLSAEIFPAGARIVVEGDPGDCAYIIVRGTCVAYKTVDGQRVVLRRAGRRVVFGETAVLSGGIRTATVEAGRRGPGQGRPPATARGEPGAAHLVRPLRGGAGGAVPGARQAAGCAGVRRLRTRRRLRSTIRSVDSRTGAAPLTIRAARRIRRSDE